jgi:hypothetical protein
LDLFLDIQELIAKGFSDEEIQRDLELPSAAIDEIAYLRNRGEDSQDAADGGPEK